MDNTSNNKQHEHAIIQKIEKTWNRFKIIRAGGGRRDFPTYEVVLFEFISAIHDLILEHDKRLNEMENKHSGSAS